MGMNTFDKQWSLFPKQQHDDAETASTVRGRMKLDRYNISGKSIVEFGCGSGRFLNHLGSQCSADIIVGIDIGTSVSIARENTKHYDNVYVIRADVMNPPFKNESFDVGYTMGVLHHTKSVSKGIKRLTDTVKRSGKVAICVYADGSFYSFPSVYWARSFISLIGKYLNKNLASSIALFYSYLSAILFYPVFKLFSRSKTISGMFAYLFAVVSTDKKLSNRVLIVYDAITPEIASTHTPEDIEFLMSEFGCKNIVNTAGTLKYSGVKGTAFVGEKV